MKTLLAFLPLFAACSGAGAPFAPATTCQVGELTLALEGPGDTCERAAAVAQASLEIVEQLAPGHHPAMTVWVMESPYPLRCDGGHGPDVGCYYDGTVDIWVTHGMGALPHELLHQVDYANRTGTQAERAAHKDWGTRGATSTQGLTFPEYGPDYGVALEGSWLYRAQLFSYSHEE